MKLLKRHKEILNELIKGKGYYKTPTVPKNHKETILDDLVKLYLKDLIVFNREYVTNLDNRNPALSHSIELILVWLILWKTGNLMEECEILVKKCI